MAARSFGVAAARAACRARRVTVHSGRAGLASELTSLARVTPRSESNYAWSN